MDHLRVGSAGVGDIEGHGALHAVEIVVQTRFLVDEQGSGYAPEIERITQVRLKIALNELDRPLHLIYGQRRAVTVGNVDLAHA